LFSELFWFLGASLPFVQTEQSVSGYIDLMELLFVVMRYGILGYFLISVIVYTPGI
jgi:hypothetical protein